MNNEIQISKSINQSFIKQIISIVFMLSCAGCATTVAPLAQPVSAEKLEQIKATKVEAAKPEETAKQSAYMVQNTRQSVTPPPGATWIWNQYATEKTYSCTLNTKIVQASGGTKISTQEWSFEWKSVTAIRVASLVIPAFIGNVYQVSVVANNVTFVDQWGSRKSMPVADITMGLFTEGGAQAHPNASFMAYNGPFTGLGRYSADADMMAPLVAALRALAPQATVFTGPVTPGTPAF